MGHDEQKLEDQLLIMGFQKRTENDWHFTKWHKPPFTVYNFTPEAHSLYQYELFMWVTDRWTPKFQCDSASELLHIIMEVEARG